MGSVLTPITPPPLSTPLLRVYYMFKKVNMKYMIKRIERMLYNLIRVIVDTTVSLYNRI